jgi:hypothetical protein
VHGWQRHRPDRRDGKPLLLVVHLDLFQGDECTAVRVRLVLGEPHLHPGFWFLAGGEGEVRFFGVGWAARIERLEED